MSKIVLLVAGDSAPSRFLMELKKLCSRSLSELRRCIVEGRPFFEVKLFMNDHEEVAEKLLRIIAEAERFSASLRYFELEPDEIFEEAPLDECEVSAEVVRNILQEWPGS